MKYPQLFAELYNIPLMIHPGKLEIIEAVLRGSALGEPPAIDAAIEYRTDREEDKKPYLITSGGVAEIGLIGTLRNRVSGFSAYSGMAGYQRKARIMEMAINDPEVKAIMLDVDSGGGGVPGLFQFTDKIKQLGALKPIWAHSNEAMFSAAYAVGSTASRILGARTSEVGSIGVIAMLAEQSGFDKAIGVKYHTIYAGARKNDFNPHEPATKAALARLQAEVDALYSVFVQHVSAARNLQETAVRDTEAGIFNAAEAQSLGLLDDIQNFEDAVHELEAHVANGSRIVSISPQSKAATSTKGEKAMSDDNNSDATFTQTDLDAAAKKGKEAGEKAGLAAGIKQGVTQERERTAAILNHENATGREAQAKTIATTTGMSAEEAGKLLGTFQAAQATKTKTGSQFEAAMENLNPDLGADGDEDNEATQMAALISGTAKVVNPRVVN